MDALEIKEYGQFVRGVRSAQDRDFSDREGRKGHIGLAGVVDGVRAGMGLDDGEKGGGYETGSQPETAAKRFWGKPGMTR